uniref:YncE family protein n=1 Tax=mine drainage metagenome TaxID=410659 RepID=E6QIA6_9ZZZZ
MRTPVAVPIVLGLLSLFLSVSTLVCAGQQTPLPTELSGNPYVIRDVWRIGGEGTWDYLALDPVAEQLLIAHSNQVQVVDLTSGRVIASIPGIGEARDIVLDPSGEYGYVSDAKMAMVRVFNRSTERIIASVPTGPSPRALVFEPQTQLLFVICAAPVVATPETAPTHPDGQTTRRRNTPKHPPVKSLINVIETKKWTPVGEFEVSGRLGFAQADRNGHIFVNVEDRKTVIRFNAADVVRQLRSPATADNSSTDADPDGTTSLPFDHLMRRLSLSAACEEPSALAIDDNHMRLFVACNNGRLEIINSDNGTPVAALPIGYDTGTVAYDANHSLIFTANGGGDGSMTIIRQHVTDSYEVIQQLDTLPRARTMAENPATGRIYMVTDIYGYDLSQPSGIGTLKTYPMPGSFETLVIDHFTGR